MKMIGLLVLAVIFGSFLAFMCPGVADDPPGGGELCVLEVEILSVTPVNMGSGFWKVDVEIDWEHAHTNHSVWCSQIHCVAFRSEEDGGGCVNVQIPQPWIQMDWPAEKEASFLMTDEPARADVWAKAFCTCRNSDMDTFNGDI